jgi:hypothetical protein
MNTDFRCVQVSLFHVIESSDHSVTNHLSSSRPTFWVLPGRAYRTPSLWSPLLRVVRHLGFAINSLARHDDRPNRVHFRYGLIVHLRLLSTPPHGDAVTVGTGFQTTPARTFTLLIRCTYRRTSSGFSRSRGVLKTGLSRDSNVNLTKI